MVPQGWIWNVVPVILRLAFIHHLSNFMHHLSIIYLSFMHHLSIICSSFIHHLSFIYPSFIHHLSIMASCMRDTRYLSTSLYSISSVLSKYYSWQGGRLVIGFISMTLLLSEIFLFTFSRNQPALRYVQYKVIILHRQGDPQY